MDFFFSHWLLKVVQGACKLNIWTYWKCIEKIYFAISFWIFSIDSIYRHILHLLQSKGWKLLKHENFCVVHFHIYFVYKSKTPACKSIQLRQFLISGKFKAMIHIYYEDKNILIVSCWSFHSYMKLTN